MNGQFSVVYAGEVQTATWLRAVHGKAERPREQWKCIERRWREVRRVHFMDDVVVEGIGHVFEECQTIDVKGRLVETVITHPTGTGHIGRGQVEGLHWVIEIRKINRCISLGDWLVLRLGNEKFVILRREMFALGSIQIGVHTINLWRRTQVTQTRTALDSQFNIMILESNEGEGLGPIFTEEEWDYVMIPGGPTDTLRVIGYLGGSDRA